MHHLSIALPILFIFCGCAAKHSSLPTTGYEIVIWVKGVENKVKGPATSEQIKEVVARIVENSDDMLQLAVTDSLIMKLKNGITCVEVSVDSPITTVFGNANCSFSRLLIPINKGSNVESIVFYLGDRNTYFTPPGISSHGKKELYKLLELLNATWVME